MIKNKIMNILAIAIIFIYIMSPVHIFQNMMKMDHAHSAPITDCPYMTEVSTMCPIKFFEHLTNSKQEHISLIVLSISIFTFFVLTLLIVGFSSPPIIKSILYNKKEKYRKLIFLYVNLFSKGLLNSKVYLA